jgi:hypothetical protein
MRFRLDTANRAPPSIRTVHFSDKLNGQWYSEQKTHFRSEVSQWMKASELFPSVTGMRS